jgi:hypothetical protein
MHHFLEDVKDGTYNGYPELGVIDLPMRNQALRNHLNLPDSLGGVAISYIDPFGAAYGHLQSGDILLSIDGYQIEEDGSIELDGASVIYAELMERKQWGEKLNFEVWRDGKKVDISFSAKNKPDPFIFRNVYNERPRYVMVAGLVFSPLSREVLRSIGRGGLSEPNGQHLLYSMQYVKQDELYKQHDEFVVFSSRLPHPVNSYTSPFELGILAAVNGKPIRALQDLPEALKSPKDGFHVFEFAGIEDKLVLRVDDVAASAPTIMAQYGVPSPAYLGDSTQLSGDSE